MGDVRGMGQRGTKMGSKGVSPEDAGNIGREKESKLAEGGAWEGGAVLRVTLVHPHIRWR